MELKCYCVSVLFLFMFYRVFGDVAYNTEAEQLLDFERKRLECYILMMNSTSNNSFAEGVYCPRVWDDIMCWPETEPGTVARQHCPAYVNKFKTTEFASRECLPNGTWLDPRANHSVDDNDGWTNFLMCVTSEPVPNSKGVISLVTKHKDAFRLMYNIGYFLSLVSLLLAICVMLYFRKLHCARNYIHLNLFLSFLLRAALSVIKENTWQYHLGFPSDVETLSNGTVVYTDGPHWECRSFYTLYKYVLVASYMWIFMEAVYIHMIIFVAVFSEKARVIWYIVIGWTLPLPFVIAWAISKAFLDNTHCWNMSENASGLIWLIQGPVMVTVVFNFIFFINIVRVLLTKLNTFPNSDTHRYRTLAKSIVVLIPLFGVYFILIIVPIEQVGDTASFVMLVIEMFFNSSQGLFIAVLLCFINAEVRAEIRKSWSKLSFRRMSNVSRASQMFPAITSRSMSTRLSDVNTAFKRYHTSEIDDDVGVPLTNTLLTINDDGNENDQSNQEEIELKSNKDNLTQNGLPNISSDLKMKIKVVNIECKSRDGVSTYTTSLDIETLKNGRTVSAENILNNNVELQETTYKVADDDDDILYMDEKV